MKGKHVVQSSLLCAVMMLVVAEGPAQGQSNTFLGQNTGNPTSSGNNNTELGANALTSSTTGCCNTATGNNALLLNATCGGNTAS